LRVVGTIVSSYKPNDEILQSRELTETIINTVNTKGPLLYSSDNIYAKINISGSEKRA
jgi:hypothetical protein